jgi:hypothetical protein
LSYQVLEGWKQRTGDYNAETLKKLSHVDAFTDKLRTSRDFVWHDTPVLQDVLRNNFQVELQRLILKVNFKSNLFFEGFFRGLVVPKNFAIGSQSSVLPYS